MTKRVILCNDIIVIIKFDQENEPKKFSVLPVPLDMICEVQGNKCTTFSSFGWELWSWETESSTHWNAALLRARRYISTRTNFLFNRTGTSIESLLPFELVKLVEQLHASQVSYFFFDIDLR